MNLPMNDRGTPVAAPRLCALLTCFNRADKTLASLAALQVSAARAGVELSAVLVDDGSNDGTAEQVRERYPWVTVEVNRGTPLFWCRGMHRAMELGLQTPADYLLLLNDDTMLYEQALAVMFSCVPAASQPGGVIVVGSTQDAATGRHSYGGERVRAPGRPLSFVLVPPTDETQEVETFNGNVVLLPRPVVQQVGLLDPAFEHAMGDIDYGLRARRLGVRLLLAPGFQGACSNNPVNGTFKDVSLPLSKRWLHLLGRKGLPWRSWLVLTRRHGGWRWPAYFAWPYVKVLFEGVRGLSRVR